MRTEKLLAVGLVLAGAASVAIAADAKRQAFERVFVDAAKLDLAMVAKVKAAKPGERLFVGKDGRKHECWYIDTSLRHRKEHRPLLVRAIDEDGDMDKDGGPDLDSDLYIADWNADGEVDSAVDYQDDDHDGDVDQMGIYYWSPKDHFLGKDALRVWWGRDDGDDNQLWYDVDYTYDQTLCQWRCHFSGDETFVAFGLTEDSDYWLSVFENPFLFYDPDKDGCSEVVIRFSGLADQVEALRYSFDADDDAYGKHTHDYDFSITAIAPGSRWMRDGKTAGSELKIPESLTEWMTLRGIPTGKWLRRDKAEDFARSSKWAKVVLTWDEINANTDENVKRDPHERWEGVIAHASKNFPQIGGPPCSEFNKRNEVCAKPIDKLELYFDATDRRIHLKGATEGWMHVDYNLDGKADAEYRYVDDDGDGYFDRREIDVDADGKVDFDWKMQGKSATDLPMELKAVQSRYLSELSRDLEDSQAFIDAATKAVPWKGLPRSILDVTAFLSGRLDSWTPETCLGRRIRSTPAGGRLYVDLVRDRLLLELKERAQIEGLCSAGKYREAAGLLPQRSSSARVPGEQGSFEDFPRRIQIRLTNPNGVARESWPVVLRVIEIRKAAADFNPDDCAVVAPERWVTPREIPHQLDTIDSAVGSELSFLVDLPPSSTAVYSIYYVPKGYVEPSTQRALRWHRKPVTFPARTASAEDWVPPNIGWESDGSTSYRTYYGQFDFFGKKLGGLIYPTIGKQSYHSETEWGIDALNSEATSGCGGVTIYLDGKAWPAMNPKGKGDVRITKRQIAKGPVRCAVQVEMTNIVPDQPDLKLTLTPIIYAGRQESEVRAVATGAKDDVLLAPGFQKLTFGERAFGDPKAGCFGSRGLQTAEIGQVGLGMIGPPAQYVGTDDLPQERRYQWKAPDGKLRYWIIADWQRGQQYPVAPTIDNWHQQMVGLANELLSEVQVEIGKTETIASN